MTDNELAINCIRSFVACHKTYYNVSEAVNEKCYVSEDVSDMPAQLYNLTRAFAA